MMLRKMCREHKSLPSSYAITNELERIGELPSGSGGNADVWSGLYQGSKVAIKVLRVYSRVDLSGIEKVRSSVPFFVPYQKNPSSTDEGGIELLSRSGSMEATQTPEHFTIGRGDKIFGHLDDGFRVDGERYNHELCHRIPPDQSTETGEHFSLTLD